MDISQLCNVCKKPNDQMLMLGCVHDPCINCAAASYAQQVHIKNQNPDAYVCEICGSQTVLDSSTVNELGSLAKSYVKVPSSSRTVVVASRSKGVGNEASPNSKKKEQKKVIYYCKEHSEEELSYYCFGCTVNICPECAIHGTHKDHQVKLIKKAISQIKAEYIEVVSKIGVQQNTMTKYKDNFLRSIKEANERHSREKNVVARQFQNVRNTLLIKEKEIMKNLDEVNKENLQILTNFLQSINSHYEEVAKVKKLIEGILRKDEVQVFQSYRKLPQLNEKILQVKKQSDEIAGEMSALNTEFLQQQLKQIQNSITKLKENVKKEMIGSTVVKGNPPLQST